MRTSVLLVALAVVLAGCTQKPKEDETETPPKATITGVTIETPAPAVAGASEVCWNVEGTGTAPHVAIHWDTESHANASARTFAQYDAGAAYPHNAAALATDGYALPGRFCADVDVPDSGSLYIVGHALVDAPGVISGEVVLAAVLPPPPPVEDDLKGKGVATSVDLVAGGATSGEAGAKVPVCWTVTGTGNVAHVAIHWDDASHPEDDRTFAAYDLGAAYPDNASALAEDGYELSPTGARFCAAVTLPASGSVWVVGHVLDVTGPPGLISDERKIDVAVPDDGEDDLPPPPEGTTITISDFAFAPSPLVVSPGATVTVVNEDSATHTVTSSGAAAGRFDTGDIAGNSRTTFTAPSDAGDYAYVCARHSSMIGSLRVQ